MPDNDFGFGDKLRQFKPAQSEQPDAAALRRADHVAGRSGFSQREPNTEELYQRQRKDPGPTRNITTRMPVRVAAALQEFCDMRRLSYWEGVAVLLQHAGQLEEIVPTNPGWPPLAN